MIAEWEKGAKIVNYIKSKSDENKLMRLLRTIYYKAVKKMSDVDQIEHFSGFGLYEKDFISEDVYDNQVKASSTFRTKILILF